MRNKFLLLLCTAGALLTGCAEKGATPAPKNMTTLSANAITGTAYYVSNTGSDANAGTSPAAPFKTLAKVNQLALSHGDGLLFASGQTFVGTLKLSGNANTNAADPVHVSTYGADSTKATIYAEAGTPAVQITDFSGIDVSNLKVEGAGQGTIGVEVWASENAPGAITNTRLSGIEASGFAINGINAHASSKGLQNLVITRADVHDCGEIGIFTYSDIYPTTPSKNFTVTNSHTYRIRGNPKNTEHTGNGILISGVVGALVEHSRANECGQNNAGRDGGPMGIWCYDAKKVVIQFCESDHNYRSKAADGGGFDIDGGSQDCVIQYCYSHDNQGEGYGMFEFGSPTKYTGNILRFNISANDGEGIAYWARDGFKLYDSYAYNNTIVGGYIPLRVDNNNMQNMYFMNNLYVGPATQLATSFTNLQLYNNQAVPSLNFVNDYHLPAGSPLASAGGQLDPVYNDRDYYQQPLNGVFPVGASK
jgi:hypothetical protein